MIGQGSHVKSLSPPVASSDPCGSEVLGTPFTTSPCLPLPTPSDLRRLAKAPHPTHLLKCPRCDSLDTKFCYYNNYSLSQPRYFCKNCKRYWTAGGALRNVPVGGGLRKNKRCKLKLQAEAEAAAAAARDLIAHEASAQLQQFEGKALSPSSVAMGSSSTSTPSIVPGIPAPANFVATAALPSFHSSNATHLLRTSSGSDGSTVEYAGNDNCGSVAAGAQQQKGNQLQHFFSEVRGPAAVPQFYSSYSTSLPASNLQQYGGTLNERGASYHAVRYVSQFMPSSSDSMNLLSGNKGTVGPNPAHAINYSNGAAAYHHEKGAGSNLVSNYSNGGAAGYYAVIDKDGREGGDVCSNEMEEEKEEIINTNPHYDWQLISENLFNGAASEGFVPLPGGSWPDFSQFQDPSGPG